MDTKKILNAQLNVSKYYTIETIDNLINILKQNEFIAYYNTETKSIDIETESKDVNMNLIKSIVKEWLNTIEAEEKYIKIMCDNLDFIFNFIQIYSYDNKTIVKVYLY